MKLVWMGLAVLTVGLADIANASRTDVIDALAPLVSRQNAFNFDVEHNAGTGTVRIGAPIELVVQASRPGNLRLVLVNTHGVVEMEDPLIGPYGNRLEAGVPAVLPGDEQARGVLEVRPPEGLADLFLILTERPIPPPSRATNGANGTWMLGESESPSAVAELAAALESAAFGDSAVSRLSFGVEAAGERSDYSSGQIVRYFTEQTRSIDRPRLDLFINFLFDSTDMTEESLPRLETWGQALSDPLLAAHRFRVGGHTDDLGNPAYNLALSRQRAETVRAFLVERYGISPDRLVVEGFGERRPLVPDATDDETRAINRRVDFERITTFQD